MWPTSVNEIIKYMGFVMGDQWTKEQWDDRKFEKLWCSSSFQFAVLFYAIFGFLLALASSQPQATLTMIVNLSLLLMNLRYDQFSGHLYFLHFIEPHQIYIITGSVSIDQ